MKRHWFRSCDFLNIPMSLSYKNEIFYSTSVGAFLTIVVFFVIIFISIYEMKALYDKSYFTIISNQYTDLSETLNFEQVPFLFQLTTQRGIVIQDEKLCNMKAYFVEYSKNNETSSSTSSSKGSLNKELELDKCDKILKKDLVYFSMLNLSTFYCIKPGQNNTSFGLLGDMNNGFKGFRIYIYKCNNSSYCYEDDVIESTLKNSKILVMYLSLDTNIYSLDPNNLNYQLFSQGFSLSTSLLKKIYFTFNVGRFYLFDNILFRKKTQFDFIALNSLMADFDLDPTSTMSEENNTIAYISFHYSGNVLEISKEVKRFFDAISLIGNTFNIVLTLIKMINNYYSNKILFVDIFGNIFFDKEFNYNISQSTKNLRRNLVHFKNYSVSKKKNLDISEELSLNNKVNFNKIILTKKGRKHSSFKSIDKRIINNKNITPAICSGKKKPTLFKIEEKKFGKSILFYYLIPYWMLKKFRTFAKIYLIKEKICTYFSIEKISELIRFKEILDNIQKEHKYKVDNSEIIPINDNKGGNHSFNNINFK